MDKHRYELCDEIIEYIKLTKPQYFYELWEYALESREDWANLLREKNFNLLAKEYIKSMNRDLRKQARSEGGAKK